MAALLFVLNPFVRRCLPALASVLTAGCQALRLAALPSPHVAYIVLLSFFSALLTLSAAQASEADNATPLNLAVAGNFAEPLRDIARAYQQQSGRRVNVLVGATGKHYAQIINGAPIDIFFAADSDYPARLAKAKTHVGQPAIYAVGELYLWQPNNRQQKTFEQALAELRGHIAIANPARAPYGQAAREALTQATASDTPLFELVYGEHIGQAFQFVVTGSAQAGFVAKSQLIAYQQKTQNLHPNSYWRVPPRYYSPIRQSLVVIHHDTRVRDFLHFFYSEQSKDLIQRYGYRHNG